ncbi:uncharacterized protein LOC144609304 [Rhinoraja longicauda]
MGMDLPTPVSPDSRSPGRKGLWNLPRKSQCGRDHPAYIFDGDFELSLVNFVRVKGVSGKSYGGPICRHFVRIFALGCFRTSPEIAEAAPPSPSLSLRRHHGGRCGDPLPPGIRRHPPPHGSPSTSSERGEAATTPVGRRCAPRMEAEMRGGADNIAGRRCAPRMEAEMRGGRATGNTLRGWRLRCEEGLRHREHAPRMEAEMQEGAAPQGTRSADGG